MVNTNPNQSSYLHESDYGFQPHTPPSYRTTNASPSSHDNPLSVTRSPPASSDLSYPSSSCSGVLVPEPSSSQYQYDYRTSSPANTVVPSDSASLAEQREEAYPHHPSYPPFNPPNSSGDLGLLPEHQSHPAYHDPYSTDCFAQSQPNGLASSSWAQQPYDEDEERRSGLVNHAAGMGRNVSDENNDEEAEGGKREVRFSGMGYADPTMMQRGEGLGRPGGPPTMKEKMLAQIGLGGRNPIEQQIENKRRGIGKQRRPWGAWTLAVAMIAVMVVELVRNKQLTGSVIAIKPTFNWMSASLLFLSNSISLLSRS
jgi:hypothetical protein